MNRMSGGPNSRAKSSIVRARTLDLAPTPATVFNLAIEPFIEGQDPRLVRDGGMDDVELRGMVQLAVNLGEPGRLCGLASTATTCPSGPTMLLQASISATTPW